MKNNYVLYRVHISCSQKKGRKGYAVVIDSIYWCMFFITVFVLIKENN